MDVWNHPIPPSLLSRVKYELPGSAVAQNGAHNSAFCCCCLILVIFLLPGLSSTRRGWPPSVSLVSITVQQSNMGKWNCVKHRFKGSECRSRLRLLLLMLLLLLFLPALLPLVWGLLWVVSHSSRFNCWNAANQELLLFFDLLELLKQPQLMRSATNVNCARRKPIVPDCKSWTPQLRLLARHFAALYRLQDSPQEFTFKSQAIDRCLHIMSSVFPAFLWQFISELCASENGKCFPFRLLPPRFTAPFHCPVSLPRFTLCGSFKKLEFNPA